MGTKKRLWELYKKIDEMMKKVEADEQSRREYEKKEWNEKFFCAIGMFIVVFVVTIVALVLAVPLAQGAILYYVWWRLRKTNCPECGGYKFGIPMGGSPACIECGWQYNKDRAPSSFLANYRKYGYYMLPVQAPAGGKKF